MPTAPDRQALHDYFERDGFARLLGIELVEIAPGFARARMTLRPELHNNLNIAHGGAIFSLADVAFAAASNSHGTVAVGISTSMSFLNAVSEGVLTAEATEVARGHKLATYDIRVTDAAGTLVAVMQGTVYRKREPLAPDH